MNAIDALETTYRQDAVRALTDAVRDEQDFSGWLALVLATIAANLGGTQALFSGRPGSWEAAHLRDLLAGTVGYDDEFLLQYRTAPVEVVECPEVTFWDLDADRYDDSAELIEQTLLGALPEPCDGQALAAAQELVAQADDALYELRDADTAAYRKAFEKQVHAAAEVAGGEALQVPVTVRFVSWDEFSKLGSEVADTLAHDLWEQARWRTRLPQTGKAPGDQLDEAEQLRSTWPHLRIHFLSHIEPPSADHGRSS